MRTVDLFLALPFLPLVILLGVYFSDAGQSRIWVLMIVMWPLPVRELRAQVMGIQQADYVKASQAMGAGFLHIGRWHLLPLLLPLIIPQFVRIAHNTILLESSLAFLGLGDPQQLSWGSMLYQANARAAFLTDAWLWWVAPPGIAIALTVTALAFVGFSFHQSWGGFRPSGDSLITASGTASSNDPAQQADQSPALQVEKLDLSYNRQPVIEQLSFSLGKGEFLALVGESGCGKSSLAHALTGLLPAHAQLAFEQLRLGDVQLTGQQSQWQKLRGKQIALIPQNAQNALNPVLSIGKQLQLAIRVHRQTEPNEMRQTAIKLLRQVGLEKKHYHQYPHQLSGGMRQRVVIAMALCHQPSVLIADEPTTGLDVVTQDEILQLLKTLQQQSGMSIVLITHNTHIATRYAQRIAVMDRGSIVWRTGEADNPIARQLFDSHFCLSQPSHWQRDTSLSKKRSQLALADASKQFFISHNRGRRKPLTAVHKCSVQLHRDEVVGLVGSSGSGKTTLSKLLAAQLTPDGGTLRIDGTDWSALSAQEQRQRQRRVHTIFQDPYHSMRPQMTVRQVLREPGCIRGEPAATTTLQQALQQVKMPSDRAFLQRQLRSLSGGQRQRIAFARALLSKAEIIIADEPTSMLDQSLQRDILDTLESIRDRNKMGLLFITHDIALAKHFCDRIVVMHKGELVDELKARDLHPEASHSPQVQSLIRATTGSDPVLSKAASG
ncbi:MAG: ATP-binding cassette domain-containing protein [Candidatus Thiodiazotropha sp. (ex Ctena orbiculata)]|nr:ATP-binding cassette domain-containing protein [Candidatus Thiodiazotropha taylori]